MAPHLRRNWAVYCLLLLLIAGFALRLLYALPDLDTGRFWDERFSARNVRSLVFQGQLRPQNAYYPSLSYLPHAAVIAAAEGLHRATGLEFLSMHDPRRSFGLSERAFLAARLVSVVAGTLTIALVFFLGRRLASPLVGLLAAGVVSASWTHLFVSVTFKPDVLAGLVAVVAFWWILDALAKPRFARYALAGVGIGLAASTKYLGASMAIPLVAGSLVATGARWRTGWRLALAGVATVATFVLLNPWLGLIAEDLAVTEKDYARKAAAAGDSHWTVLVEGVRWVVRDLRPVVALFAGFGCVGLAARAWRRVPGRPGRTATIAVLAAIFGYAGFYALVTSHFRAWNYMPVLPFAALVAAWAMVASSEWLLEWLPEGARTPIRGTLWPGVGVLFLSFPVSLIYMATVPTTWEVARESLSRLEGIPAVVVYGEGVRAELERETHPPGFLFLEVESLGEVPVGDLTRANAVVFPSRALEGPEASFYRRLAAPEGRSVSRVEPRWFRTRGPSLEVVRRPWRLRRETVHRPAQEEGGNLEFSLPEPLRPGEIVSLAVRARRHGQPRFPRTVRLAGAGEAPLYPLRRTRLDWLVTPKVGMRQARSSLVVGFPELAPRVQLLEVRLYRWKRPDEAEP